jgi:hypothetical protein
MRWYCQKMAPASMLSTSELTDNEPIDCKNLADPPCLEGSLRTCPGESVLAHTPTAT